MTVSKYIPWINRSIKNDSLISSRRGPSCRAYIAQNGNPKGSTTVIPLHSGDKTCDFVVMSIILHVEPDSERSGSEFTNCLLN